jgi:dihydroneopterin aldolase
MNQIKEKIKQIKNYAEVFKKAKEEFVEGKAISKSPEEVITEIFKALSLINSLLGSLAEELKKKECLDCNENKNKSV